MFKCKSCPELTSLVRELNAQLLAERESYERLRAESERQVGALLEKLLAVNAPAAIHTLKAEPRQRPDPTPKPERNPLPAVPPTMSADLLFEAIRRHSSPTDDAPKS